MFCILRLPTPDSNTMLIEITAGLFSHVDQSAANSLRIDGVEIPLPANATFLPGLVDTHCHLMGAGEMAVRVDLRGARSAEECGLRMSERARDVSPGSWIL